jgi:hypothetical protein
MQSRSLAPRVAAERKRKFVAYIYKLAEILTQLFKEKSSLLKNIKFKK